VQVVLIAEMLLLVAVDDKRHAPAGSNAFVKVGLTGALLAELAIGGQLRIGDDGMVRTADTRPCDELLADVYLGDRRGADAGCRAFGVLVEGSR
jgi:Golgi phosphoprotein 3 (GPP34)